MQLIENSICCLFCMILSLDSVRQYIRLLLSIGPSSRGIGTGLLVGVESIIEAVPVFHFRCVQVVRPKSRFAIFCCNVIITSADNDSKSRNRMMATQDQNCTNSLFSSKTVGALTELLNCEHRPGTTKTVRSVRSCGSSHFLRLTISNLAQRITRITTITWSHVLSCILHLISLHHLLP